MTQTKIRIEKYCAGSKRIFLASDSNLPPNPTGEQIDKAESASTDFAYPNNVVNQAIDYLHLDESAGFETVKKDIQELIISFPALPIVLIVDPLFKMFRHDLIKEDEVKYFTDNMDLLLGDKKLWENHPGMAVVIVHHARKPAISPDGKPMSSGSDDLFGSAILKWWPDTILRTSLDTEHDETKTTTHLEFTKHSRVAAGFLPSKIIIRWNKDLLHPKVLTRLMPKYPEEDVEDRGDFSLTQYE